MWEKYLFLNQNLIELNGEIYKSTTLLSQRSVEQEDRKLVRIEET